MCGSLFCFFFLPSRAAEYTQTPLLIIIPVSVLQIDSGKRGVVGLGRRLEERPPRNQEEQMVFPEGHWCSHDPAFQAVSMYVRPAGTLVMLKARRGGHLQSPSDKSSDHSCLLEPKLFFICCWSNSSEFFDFHGDSAPQSFLLLCTFQWISVS